MSHKAIRNLETKLRNKKLRTHNKKLLLSKNIGKINPRRLNNLNMPMMMRNMVKNMMMKMRNMKKIMTIKKCKKAK